MPEKQCIYKIQYTIVIFFIRFYLCLLKNYFFDIFVMYFLKYIKIHHKSVTKIIFQQTQIKFDEKNHNGILDFIYACIYIYIYIVIYCIINNTLQKCDKIYKCVCIIYFVNFELQ